MDLQGLIEQLEVLKGAVENAAAPSATAMAENFRKGVVEVTLRQISHAPGLYWEAPAGQPPAYVTGNLARSVRTTPASGTPRASAFVAAYAKYAALQAFGGETRPTQGKYMHWRNSGGSWFKERVYVPAHPYFPPTLGRQISDGSLSNVAAETFWARISPLLS
jgi:phage gpG-like protein